MNSNAAVIAELAGQTLTPSEKLTATAFVKQTLDGVTGAIQGLTPHQWTFVPHAGAWSPSLITEHLVFVLERVLGPLKEQVMISPAAAISPEHTIIDSIVIHQFPSRLNKFPSPEFALPKGRFSSVSEAREALNRLPDLVEDYLSTPGLREHALEAMPIKLATGGKYTMLDAYQWLLAATAHAERHTKQILEVRSDPNFPPA